MIGSGNARNNAMNRRQQPFQKMDDLDKLNTPKQKYYQNAYNNLGKTNFSGNNSTNKQNVRVNMNNMNNINNMNNMNNINVNSNNLNNNMNRNMSMNNSSQNNIINRALNSIRNEFKKKDDKIRELELKVAELENKINMITKSGNYQLNNNQVLNNNYMNLNMAPNLSQKKVGKNFTFGEKYSEEINPTFNNNLNKTPENYNNRNNPFRNNEENHNLNKNNFYDQVNSANQYKVNSDNDNDYMIEKKYSNKNKYGGDNARENSIITGNSSNFQGHSKNEVKLYLKEVKSKVDPIIFKEFIQNIKLLTNSKEKNGVDKKSVVEKVKMLFGEQFKDLYIKFESIIGINN